MKKILALRDCIHDTINCLSALLKHEEYRINEIRKDNLPEEIKRKMIEDHEKSIDVFSKKFAEARNLWDEFNKTYYGQQDGWGVFNITVQVGAGVQKIIDRDTNKVSQEYIVNMFERLDLFHQVQFIHNVDEVLMLSEYKYELC